MGLRVQKCRERALDCEYLADAVRDPVMRFDLMETSRQWRELADQIEFLEKLDIGHLNRRPVPFPLLAGAEMPAGPRPVPHDRDWPLPRLSRQSRGRAALAALL
jgi:hypothetical protein